MAIEGLYTIKDRRRIEKAGGLKIMPSWADRLEEAARDYILTEWGERDFLKTKKERRGDLLRVVQAARNGTPHDLDEAIGELDYPAIRALPTNAGPAAIVEAAESAAEIAGRGGAPLKRARRHFITFLAAMYLRLTGHWPALMNDPATHEAYGPFLDFCRACIEPLVDLCGLKDFKWLKRKFDSVRGTYATTTRPTKRKIWFPGGKSAFVTVTLLDTMLLAPAGHRSLSVRPERS